jgi:DNA polymerase I
MKLLIDTEVYLYRAAAGSEKEMEWAPDDWTYVCRHGDAKATFQDTIAEMRETLPDHSPVLVFGDRRSFRKKYRKPAGYAALQEWVSNLALSWGWEVVKLPEVEGDDVLGILYEPGDVIVSSDKDMLTIPGLHLRDGLIHEVSRGEADLNFYTQVLTGDAADNYPGCPGFGPVTAKKALLGCVTEQQLWGQVLASYEKKGYGEPYVIAQARCARILRTGEYDHEKGLPLLWGPPVT